jgi:hypothetical protein
MPHQLWPNRMVALAGAAVLLSGTSMFTCGSAAANGITEALEQFVREEASRTPNIAAEDAVRETRPAIDTAVTAAGGDDSQTMSVINRACEINKVVNRGYTVYDALNGYSESEREKIRQEFNALQNMQNTRNGVALVAIYCRFQR